MQFARQNITTGITILRLHVKKAFDLQEKIIHACNTEIRIQCLTIIYTAKRWQKFYIYVDTIDTNDNVQTDFKFSCMQISKSGMAMSCWKLKYRFQATVWSMYLILEKSYQKTAERQPPNNIYIVSNLFSFKISGLGFDLQPYVHIILRRL